MEKHNCSFEKHLEIEAKKYCPACRIYMCNKCKTHHSNLFTNHHPYNLDEDIDEDLFTGYCKEKNHYDIK